VKNLILLISILISYVATANESIHKNNLGSPDPKAFLIDKDSKKVDFIEVTKHNLNQSQIGKMSKYIPVMNEVLGSKCFRVFMESRDLIDTNGKTNSQIVEHIRSSKVGVELKSYYKWKGPVGYTYPSVNKI